MSEPGRVTGRLRCCICGLDTTEADDYVQLTLSTEATIARQVFGAHAACLDGVMAGGFRVEVHVM